jgi:hypothetical protein
MDINDIKSTGPGSQIPSVSNTDRSVKDASSFQQVQSAGAPSGAGGILAGVASQFRKADLQDPQKVESMLSQCTGTLVNSALGKSNEKLSPEENSYLCDWLQNDQGFRGKLLDYLNQVLT